MLYRWILPSILYVVYNCLRFTWRITVLETEAFAKDRAAGQRMVYAHWHGSIPSILYLLKPYKVATMISSSQDGTLVDTLARWLGGKTARGSSTRGGATALKGILRLANAGWNVAIATDGPKGPRHKVKPGVLEIARVLDASVYTLTAACDRAWVFEKAWDKTAVPKPFARVIVQWGDPVLRPGRTDDARDPNLALRLETALVNAEQHVRNLIAAKSASQLP